MAARSFHEIVFPLAIALQGRGGPRRRTDIVTTGSGREGLMPRASAGLRLRRSAGNPRPPFGHLITAGDTAELLVA